MPEKLTLEPSVADATNTAEAPPLRWRAKIAYALGGIAQMIEQRGISAFLLIFYNQVIGMPPHLVAGVMLIASIFDSLFDPVVGQISDGHRSRWGRRHPFIYASVLPVAVGYFLLWCPPVGWSQMQLAGYLLATLLVLRLFDTFFELPSSALLPELTRNYDERTAIISLRTMFALLGGTAMTMLAYQIFLKENSNGGGGILAREGYVFYGLTAACVIASAILISAVGTHHRIRHLSQPAKREPTLTAMFHAVGATLNNRSFIALLMVGVLMSVANGARLALELYYNVYFWQLPQTQLSVLLLATIVGILPGVTLAPLLARRLGKRQLVTIVIIGGIVGNVGPVLGRLAGVMPANGTPTLFAILFADVAFTFCMATMTTIMLTSMMNDVVEDVEVKTGRRSEGLLLAADSFFKKLVSSVGVFVSGVMLTVIGFPQHAVRGKVAPEIVVKLAYGYLPITALYLIAFCLLSFYQIDRAKHESNLALLKRRAQAP